MLTQTLTTRQPSELSVARLNAMRAGYLLIGVGWAVARWPLLVQAHTMPLYEGVTLCVLTAMSVLALVGVRYPIRLLPVLLFESTWKLLWLTVVAIPTIASGTLDEATSEVAINCSLVIVIVAVTPWRYVWRTFVRATGDPWR